jgi:hypothetical protein
MHPLQFVEIVNSVYTKLRILHYHKLGFTIALMLKKRENNLKLRVFQISEGPGTIEEAHSGRLSKII